MRGNFTIVVLILALVLSGCAGQPPIPTAGLTTASNDEIIKWGLPDQLQQQGTGNSYRVMVDQGRGTEMLELAAGNQGSMEYFVEVPSDVSTFASMRLEFLSTQGSGRIKLSTLDNDGNILGETGFVYTGQLPSVTDHSKWQDVRYINNYQGGWLESRYNFSEMLKDLPQDVLARTAKYRLSVEIGQGQHALITQFATGKDIDKAVRIIPNDLQYTAKQEDVLNIETDVENISHQPLENIVMKLLEPYGYGVVALSPINQVIAHLAPGEKQHISWQVQAQRSDAVNLNQPWSIGFSVNDIVLPTKVGVQIADSRPGKVFYVMTEDLEPIDGAGYAKAWGNSDGWLEPEELMGQMVQKAAKLDEIAEKHGAKWTHYIAWPAVKAAEWAAGQSKSGEWAKTVAAIKASVIKEADKGHEYGIHFHSDYDPYLSGNVLSYNDAVDGLWANHLKHGWAHSVIKEGDFNDYNSRAGMLYNYLQILEQLEIHSPQGQQLTARAGSFDFAYGSADEAASTGAYQKVGLWGSSDADGNSGGITSGEYGREIYFAAPDDISTPAKDITKLGIVEFRPTPKEPISYNDQSAAIMNHKADQGMEYFTTGAAGIKPGIHAIMGFTHAMFIMGQGDWKSLEGGQFQALDDHLSYVKSQYADKGLLAFATASELVEAYLDYYTPQLLAVYGPQVADQYGIAEYKIRILGQDIPIDREHSHAVSVKYPLYLRDSAYRISILKNGQPIYSTWGLPTPSNDILFTVDDKTAVYTLKIYHNELAFKFITQIRSLKEKIFKKI
jgi:hypothetical protein